MDVCQRKSDLKADRPTRQAPFLHSQPEDGVKTQNYLQQLLALGEDAGKSVPGCLRQCMRPFYYLFLHVTLNHFSSTACDFKVLRHCSWGLCALATPHLLDTSHYRAAWPRAKSPHSLLIFQPRGPCILGAQ